MATSSSSEEFLDVSLATPLGPLEFRRFYTGNARSWTLHASLGTLTDPYIPVPFASALNVPNGISWWHNFFSFVAPEPSWAQGGVHIRYPSGQFTALKAPASWSSAVFLALSDATTDATREDTNRVLWNPADGGSFTVFRDGRPRLIYAAKLESPGGGMARYFLSRIETPEYPGHTIATLAYQPPPSGCPGGASNGVPYLSTVTASGGVKLRFRYAPPNQGIPGSKVAFECPISGVDVVGADGSVRPALDYSVTYNYNGGVDFVATNYDKPAALHGQSYEFLSEGFWEDSFSLAQWRGGFVGRVWTHPKAAGAVTSSRIAQPGMADVSEWSGFGNTFTPAPCPTDSPAAPCVAVHSLTQDSVMHGDGMWWPGSVQRSATSVQEGWASGPRISGWRDLATDAGEDWLYSSGTTSPAHNTAHRGRSGAWDVSDVAELTASAFDGATFTPPYEVRSVKQGAADSSGTNATDTRSYDYSYGGQGQTNRAWEQFVEREHRPSLLSPGADAETRWTHDPVTNQLLSVIRTGYTKKWVAGNSWPVASLSVGTFYSRTQAWGCAPSSDSLGRVVEVHGPCRVSGPAALYCDAGGQVPITAYEYYAAGGPNSLMLKAVTRFPSVVGAGNCGPGLRTEYSNYTPYGQPGTVTDPNGVVTTYTYVADHVASRNVGGNTWRYAWDYGHLFSIQSPSGMYEVFCHRGMGGAGGLCNVANGAPTEQIQQHFLAMDETGVGWSELEEYTYWPDGRLQSVATRTPTEYRERRSEQANEDGFTSLRLGGSGANEVRLFDAAGNQRGLGLPFDGAQPLCGGLDAATGRVVDPRCAALTYDLGDRLIAMDEPANPAASPAADDRTTRTCLRYDVHGNIVGVKHGCAAYADCSTCGGANGAAQENTYAWDDFGRLVEYQLANTSNGAGGRGITNIEYSPLGQPVRKQSDAMRTATWAPAMVAWNYDGVGRLKEQSSASCYWYCTFTPLFGQAWDSTTAPPSGCDASILTNAKGRRASSWDSLWTTWYGYDPEGRITAELRTLGQGNDCTAAEGELWSVTRYAYNANGDLVSIKYPHGRTVAYDYGAAALARRVASIAVTQYTHGTWSPAPAIQNVTWEPFGALRNYRVVAPNGAASWADVEYLKGQANLPYSSSCARSTSENDLTGRLRTIRVMTDSGAPAFWKDYQWHADQLEQTATCYVSTSGAPITEQFSYTARKQLSGAWGTRSSTGGANDFVQFSYDARGNRTGISGADGQLTTTWSSAAPLPDQVLSETSAATGPNTGIRSDYEWTGDGQLAARYGPFDSSGSRGTVWDFRWGESDGTAYGGSSASSLEAVFRTVSINPADGVSTYWNMSYDGQRQRLRKSDPTGNATDYAWDQEHHLIEDLGFRQTDSATQGQYRPIDEYVWLGGRPVMAIRARFQTAPLARADDNQGDCSRLDDASQCGSNFPVTDLVGRPIVTLDRNMRVASVGEYQPFGHVNRAQWLVESGHPYSTWGMWTVQAQPVRFDMTTSTRVHFPLIDTEACPGTEDSIYLINAGSWTFSPNLGGYHRGDVWSPWIPGDGLLYLFFGGNPPNLPPTCSPGTEWPYAGLAVSEYEYRKSQVGALPYQPLIRGAGQYYDAETDLFENWNRYYDPGLGRYLSPEPMLQNPQYVKSTTMRGQSVPTYAYAGNNPIGANDPTGLFKNGQFYPEDLTEVEVTVAVLASPVGPALVAGFIAGFGAAVAMSPPTITTTVPSPEPNLTAGPNFTAGPEPAPASDQCGSGTKCPPCVGPMPDVRIDMNPSPTRRHGCPGSGSHVHYFVFEQRPSDCRCFTRDRVACL